MMLYVVCLTIYISDIHTYLLLQITARVSDNIRDIKDSTVAHAQPLKTDKFICSMKLPKIALPTNHFGVNSLHSFEYLTLELP
jgi:hypothetical protein